MVNNNPLTGKIPEEVPLENAPLVRVIAQMRFPPILSVEKKDCVSLFQEVIRKEYPILEPERTETFKVAEGDYFRYGSETTWRFRDRTKNWIISLSSSSLAIETKKYSSRTDFIERLGFGLQALDDTFKPQIVERLGLRYVDQILGENLKDLYLLVNPEISGMLNLEFQKYLNYSINESLFFLPDREARIFARWGILPKGDTFDPEALEAIDEPSWILDLDMSGFEFRPFVIEEVTKHARCFSERLYAFFRWAVKDEFLQRYGAKL